MKRSQWTFNVAVDFWRGKKAVMAGRDGRDLFLASLGWSAEQETDGFVPVETIDMLCGWVGISRAAALKAAKRLVDVALWEVVDGGWRIHDWDDWQYTAAEREKQRADAKARQGRFRNASRNGTSNALHHTLRDPVTPPVTNGVISHQSYGFSFMNGSSLPPNGGDDDENAFIDGVLVLVGSAKFERADQDGKVESQHPASRDRYRATCERNALTDAELRRRAIANRQAHPEWTTQQMAAHLTPSANVFSLPARAEPAATCRWCHAFLSKHHAEDECSQKPFEEAQP